MPVRGGRGVRFVCWSGLGLVLVLWAVAGQGAVAQSVDAGLRSSCEPGAREARARGLRLRGEALRRAGDASSALAYFRDAIRVDPRDAESYQALGEIYLERSAWRDAMEACSSGLGRRPEHGPLWVLLARALVALGRAEDAASVLRERTERVPSDMAAQRARAENAEHNAAWSEALSAYEAIADAGESSGELGAEERGTVRRRIAALRVILAATVRCDPSTPVIAAITRCR